MTNSNLVFLGDKPDGVSPSRVSQFTTCPRQYQYVSVEKLPEKKSIDAYRGTIFHAILEALFRDQPTPADRTIDNAMGHFRDLYPQYMTPEIMVELGFDDAARDKMAAEITKLIRNYWLMEDPTTVELVSTEIRLDYDMGGWGLRGIIDRLDRLPDGSLAIRDYKTGKVPQERYQAKALQACQVYAYLCEKVYGETPSVMSLIYVKGKVTIERKVTRSDIEGAEQRVKSVWAAIERSYERSYFEPKPSVLCKWCSFREICESDRYSVF
jgi:putative RecB family exonuclease